MDFEEAKQYNCNMDVIERSFTMVTLTFVFDKNKIAIAGLTEEELLRPMREYARNNGILEDKQGVFTKDGSDALCLLTMFVTRITRRDLEYVSYFESWTLNVDGEVEDCISETLKWYKKKGIRPMADK